MNAVDELGTIQAQIAELRIREKELKGAIFATGDTEGDLFKASIIEAERRTVDWKAVANKLNPSHQLVRAHSKTTQVTSIKVTARSTAARRAA
jgi:hypothetical protein